MEKGWRTGLEERGEELTSFRKAGCGPRMLPGRTSRTHAMASLAVNLCERQGTFKPRHAGCSPKFKSASPVLEDGGGDSGGRTGEPCRAQRDARTARRWYYAQPTSACSAGKKLLGRKGRTRQPGTSEQPGMNDLEVDLATTR